MKTKWRKMKSSKSGLLTTSQSSFVETEKSINSTHLIEVNKSEKNIVTKPTSKEIQILIPKDVKLGVSLMQGNGESGGVGVFIKAIDADKAYVCKYMYMYSRTHA